ncbi:pimeloyl-ACP methyl ester carboxylesterase [Kribbella sandramycini]|uniref:Pimeloyl-ACP methyl ester carboxylesterase n=1 Tax=Kribbella sandramycini TaxID=60450 RepID=A0A841S6W7_9ACTN|nr:pimeloyl-ACP methyl ester carboxylesterase [Kribbella sandramycini]
MEPEFVDIGGARTATYVLTPDGESAGDVVLCHGTPWSAQVWAEVAWRLSCSHRVFLWDMPGYGRSPKNAPVDLCTQMRRFATLVSHWGLDQPHVVAHDIGAAVALGAHLLHDVDYADLFLWDAVVLDPWGSPFFRLVAQHADVFSQLPAALHTALLDEYISGAANDRLTITWLDTLTRPWRGATGQPAFYRQIAALTPTHTRPLTARLSRTRCPVRIGWGAEDPWLPLKQAYNLQSQFPGTPKVIELKDVGHLAPVEAPQAVAHAIGEWLEGASVGQGCGDLGGGLVEVGEEVAAEGVGGGAGGVGGDVEGGDDAAAGVVDGDGDGAEA